MGHWLRLAALGLLALGIGMLLGILIGLLRRRVTPEQSVYVAPEPASSPRAVGPHRGRLAPPAAH